MVGDQRSQCCEPPTVAGADLTTSGWAVPKHQSRRPARSLVTTCRPLGAVLAVCSVVAATALAAAPAAVSLAAATKTMPAHTAKGGFFLSPSLNISCEMDYHRAGLNGVFCQTDEPPRSVSMSQAGAIKKCSGVQCLGNPPENALVLPYGHATSAGPYTCTSRIRGMTCTVGHKGFTISREGITERS